jgi:hypothetical protein
VMSPIGLCSERWGKSIPGPERQANGKPVRSACQGLHSGVSESCLH